jgi:molybdopterin molybdotransferase
LIEVGTAMGPLQTGVAAACGYPGVRVFRILRVAIFTTGSELRQPGENIQPGEIYDANRFILRSLLAQPWIEIIDLGSCVDKPSRLRAIFQTAAAHADVIISAGGISVGDEDHVVDAFQVCGGKLWVRKVAIKPGKPLVLGKMADALYVGLPGNPGALFTTFKIIAEQNPQRSCRDQTQRRRSACCDRKFRLEGAAWPHNLSSRRAARRCSWASLD